MSMDKNASIEIRAAANGYLVGEPYSLSNDGRSAISEMMVFESYVGLAAWLEAHFTHRAEHVLRDFTPSVSSTET